MSSLKSLREEINRAEAIFDVMGTLEKVAGFERTKSQKFFNTIQGYDQELLSFFNGLLPIRVESVKTAKKGASLLLCFGPDHGLTGPFAERFLDFIAGEVDKIKPAKILAIGKELKNAFRNSKLPFDIEFFSGQETNTKIDVVHSIAEKILKGIERKEFSEVYLAASKYIMLGEYEFYSDKIFRFDAVVDEDKKRLDDFVFVEPSLNSILRRYVVLILASRFARPWREVKFIEASLRLLETNRAKENAKREDCGRYRA